MYINCKIVHVCADLGIVVGGGGGGMVGGAAWRSRHTTAAWESGKSQRRIQRGGVGQGFSDPLGKSQVIRGPIGNKQLDHSLEKV